MEAAAEIRKRARKDAETFTWKISSFSKLTVRKQLVSDIFEAGGRTWRIVLYPEAGGGRFLSAYLRMCSPPKWRSWWSAPDKCTQFRLTLVDQMNGHSLTKGAEHEFREGNVHAGFWPFVLHSQLYNPCKGFLVNDTLIFEAEVSTEGASLSGVKKRCGSAQRTVSACSSTEPVVGSLTGTTTSCAPNSLQFASRNWMAELASMASRMGSTTPADGIANSNSGNGSSLLLRKKKEELFGYLKKSLEDIHKSNSSTNVEEIASRIAEQTTDPIEKAILEDLVSEFKKSFSLIENVVHNARTYAVEAKNVEARLDHRGKQISCLEAEVSRLAREETKLDVEIQRLLACKAKIRGDKSSTVAEMEKVNLAASKEMDQLKERSRRGSENLFALVQFNAWWKILMKNLGGRSG